MSGLRDIKKLKYWLENDDSYIGWYSEKQRETSWNFRNESKERSIANVYLTPDGREVIITEITKSYNYSSNWDDVKMVGPVTKWVRPIYNIHKHFD